MAKYVDGYVLPIKKSKFKAYQKMAKMGSNVWMKCGALSYTEAVGDDLDMKGVLSFNKLAKIKKDEVVVFAFVTYKSKSHRDQVNKRVHKTMVAKDFAHMEMPFEMKKMAFGGFKVFAGK